MALESSPTRALLSAFAALRTRKFDSSWVLPVGSYIRQVNS